MRNFYLTLFNGSVYCAHPIGDLPIVDDKRCNDYMEKGRHTFSFRLSVDKRSNLEKRAVEFSQKPYVLNGYPHGKGRKEKESFIALSNENIVLSSLRMVGEGVYEIRLVNNFNTKSYCMLRAFETEKELFFDSYEAKTMFYKEGRLKEYGFMLDL